MNRDQVKTQLRRLEPDVDDFNVILSGKLSRKVNGLYYPEKREIILHNKNFANDNEMMYTAVHEFAHHVHFTRSPVPVGSRPHTIEFRRILHRLLERAEELGIYRSIFDTSPDFVELTRRIRERYLAAGGRIMKEFGQALLEAQQLCREHQMRFDDYVERVLRLETRTANSLIRMHAYDVSPQTGYENMKIMAGIPDPQKRSQAEQAFAAGMSRDSVRTLVSGDGNEEQSAIELLLREKQRLERTISSLQRKLEELERRLESIEA
ncbi:MAG: hypothetical protein EA384_10885 [Spirochaetaceae bacterium]|nr:MAG: hypothetical protein EA384_10885 [Spirochaetaceae bacterium]